MPESRSDCSEDLRQIEHLVPIAFAFLLPYLTWTQAVALAICALVYGVFISRLFRVTLRPNELSRGFSTGKAAYALSVLGLLAVFPGDRYIVAAVWANLSVGDAASNLVGRNFGRRKLPWNDSKTWLGMTSALLLSTLAAAILIQWNGLPPQRHNPGATAWFYAILLSLVCSLVETLPLPVDDNITICLAGGAFMGFLAQAAWPGEWNWTALGFGLLLSSTAALAAWLLRTVSVSGAVWGTLMGAVVYFSLGMHGFVLLATFFILGSLFSRAGYKKKQQSGIAQPNQGRRSARHVWGKGAAALMAAVAGLFLVERSLVMLAFTTALASSLYDTTATELGQLAGRKPILLNNFKSVSRGTAGAVSAEGSILGLLASIAIAVEAYFFQFVGPWGILWTVAAATISVHLESFLAARHKGPPAGGPMLNAFHTTVSMMISLLLARISL